MTGEAVLGEQLRDRWGLLLGQLVRRYRRVDLAEDALADAFASAASRWPAEGVPDNPGGWLAVTAQRRLVDAFRRELSARAKLPLLAEPEAAPVPQGPGDDVDDRIALLFMATHPALAEEIRPALALRFVLGTPTETIARLFVLPVPTMAARLTRAKKRITQIGIGFVVPEIDRWPERVDDVARTLLLAFTAGYAPTGGDDVVRVSDAGETVRLALLAAELLPEQPAIEALVALMLLQHSRRDARTDAKGGLVLLRDQDRTLWRRDEIGEGLRRLQRLPVTTGYAEELRLQAVIAAAHAMATRASLTDWATIVRAYSRLEQLTGSPIVRLNRAVAVAELSGPMAGLAVLREAAEQLPGHHRVAIVRAELLRRDGQRDLARAAYDDALRLTRDGPERRHVQERLASL